MSVEATQLRFNSVDAEVAGIRGGRMTVLDYDMVSQSGHKLAKLGQEFRRPGEAVVIGDTFRIDSNPTILGQGLYFRTESGLVFRFWFGNPSIWRVSRLQVSFNEGGKHNEIKYNPQQIEELMGRRISVGDTFPRPAGTKVLESPITEIVTVGSVVIPEDEAIVRASGHRNSIIKDYNAGK